MNRLQLLGFGFFFFQRKMLSFLFPEEEKKTKYTAKIKQSYMQNRSICKITIKHGNSLHILVFNSARIKIARKMFPSF